MKTFFTALLIAIVACSSLFALSDSVYAYGEVPEYKAMERAIKEQHPYEETKTLYEAYAKVASDAYAIEKGEYEYARYLVDIDRKQEAETHLELLKAASEEVQAAGGFLAAASYSDYLSVCYYIHKNLSHALENNDALKKLYKNYPDEVLSRLNEAWRNYYAPAVAGGSKKKAIEEISK